MANSEMRPFEPEEIPKLMAQFEGRFEYRNKSLIALGVCTGFRIAELMSLRIDDVYYFGEIKDQIKLPRRLLKGKQPRKPKKIFPEAKELLSIWIKDLKENYRATRRSFLFASREGGALTTVMCWRIIKSAAISAGIPPDGIGTHSLRKTFANAVYDFWDEEARKGRRVEPMRMVQVELGHASIDDTYRYMAFKLEEKPDDIFQKYNFLLEEDLGENEEITGVKSMLH